MEVGTEISQKIRSAIKAKLMELGAYVDDELPDYIMVMVANKKNKSQMKADLSLFLGGNTETFTSWLHGLLGKLQTITVESSKDKNDKSKNSKEKKKDKVGTGSLKSKSDSTKGKKVGKDKSRKRKSSRDGVEDAPKAKVSVSKTVELEENENSETQASQPQNPEVSETTNQELSESAEDKPEVNETSNVKQTFVQEEFEDVRQLLVATTPGDDLAEELDAAEEEVSSAIKTSMSSQTANASNKESQNKSAVSDDSHGEKLVKRKVPSSVVATVSRDKDDEEYDPFNPAVGSVASVVKVTSRKASFPPSMQANRQSSSVDDHVQFSEADQESSTDNVQTQIMRNVEPQIVNLEIVKQALSDILEKFQFSCRQDEIGSFARHLESILRQFDRQAFLQAKSQILKLLSTFDTVTCSSTEQNLCSVNKDSKGEKEAARGKVLTNISEVKNGDVPYNTAKAAVNESQGPDRIIFSSKSNKSPMLTSSERGSEYYRDFVSSILKPVSQEPTAEQTSANGSCGTGQGGSNTPTQPLVSSIRLEIESPRAGFASSSPRSKAFVSLSSSSKLTHSPSPSSTASPLLSLAQGAITAKVSGVDPGFHRLRSQILVDSLHVRRRPDSASSSPSTPLLQHAWRRRQAGDKDEVDPLLGEGGSNSPSSQSPQHYSGEALKVLAKNLRVTIINRHAKGVEESSTGEDSSSDDESDEDSSDKEQETEEAKDIMENTEQSSNNDKLNVL